jgi:predicted P-loop ATPase
MGMALVLLHPKSKRPVETGWTKGPRRSWEELEKAYSPGMNVGVRLGKASHVGGGYLAVIDIDVKSQDPRHQREAYDKVKEIFGDKAFEGTPKVQTGRGNGSAHIYVKSDQPASTKRVGQSSETCKVKLGGEPSKRDKEKLSKAEIESGLRVRAAWEISIMGEGGQVVLPPSIHPDTGKAYKWNNDFDAEAFDLCLVGLPGQINDGKNDRQSSNDISRETFTPEEIDLVSSSLSNEVVDQITSGKGVEDRSAALFSVCMSMVRAKFTDNQILSVLTDESNFLGQAGYDHAKTESRTRAAQWVRKYSLEKARREVDAKFAFDAEVEETPLDDEQAAIQEIELLTPEDWRELLERTGPVGDERPKGTVKNIVMIFRGELGEDLFTKNEFSGLQLYTRETPWGGKPGGEITDEHVTRIKHWLSKIFRFEPATDKINEAITVIAAENSFHPIKDYLESLEWDGVPRIDTWLKVFCSAQASEPYLSAVSRKVLVASIARIYNPGVKFDQVLILEGDQGIKKSTTIRVLAGDWFSDAHINISDKDGVLSMRSAWFVELGELSGMRKADTDALKEFISRNVDRIRVPYGRRTENFPRQCVFIGTTNSTEYLKDVSGNRRFWPVAVGECYTDSLALNRDQLFAEAKFVYDVQNEPLYLEDRESQRLAVGEQNARMISDTLTDKVQEYLEKVAGKEGELDPNQFVLSSLFGPFGPLRDLKENMVEQKRAADSLRKLGYVSKIARGPQGLRKYWFKGVNPLLPVTGNKKD